MQFRDFTEPGGPVAFDEALRGRDDVARPFGKLDSELLTEPLQPSKELGSGQDRRGRDRHIRLGSDARLQPHLPTFGEELTLQPGGIGELVGDHEFARTLFEDVLDRPRMAPSEQIVEVRELGVQLVVLRRADGDDGVGAGLPNRPCQPEGLPIRELLGVLHPLDLGQVLGSDKAGGDDERAEVVPLPALVDADMAFVGQVVRQHSARLPKSSITLEPVCGHEDLVVRKVYPAIPVQIGALVVGKGAALGPV